jgi:hypothetical protein
MNGKTIDYNNASVQNQANIELSQLEKLNELAQKAENLPTIANAKIATPVQQVEKSLSKFIEDAFAVTREDFELGKVLNKALTDKIESGSFSENQLIALFNGYQININDKISKMVAPTLQLMTSRQQAEISAQAQVSAAEKQGGGNITSLTSINQAAPNEVLVGVKQLTDLLTAITQKNKNTNELGQQSEEGDGNSWNSEVTEDEDEKETNTDTDFVIIEDD